MLSDVGRLLRSYGALLRKVYNRIKAAWLWMRWYGLFRPETSVKLPDKVASVLFVCKGNICRSPLAEVYFRSRLTSGCGITVWSAGLDTTDGKPAHPLAKAVAELHGLTLDKHRTTQITREMVDKADVIFVMELTQLTSLVKLCPRIKDKTYVLSQINGSGMADIADPFSGTIDDFHACLKLIRDSCDNLVTQIQLGNREYCDVTVSRGPFG